MNAVTKTKAVAKNRLANKIITEVFRSPRRDEMYLYVDKTKGLQNLPEELLEHFGTPEPVMTLLVTPTTRLARVQAAEVFQSLRSKGYYLQWPPPREAYLLDLYKAPTEARY